MNQMNDLLVADCPNGRFITAVIAAVEPRDRTVLIYSAGHGPSIFYDASERRTHRLAANDVPLGLTAPLANNDLEEFHCDPGDLLLLLTDGFFEWSNRADQHYGMTRLEQFVGEHHALKPEQFIKALHDDVLAFSEGTPQEDDLTAVVLKCVGA